MKLEKDILIPANLEINPWVYLDIVLKYKYYLKLIMGFGGYMFLQHIYKFSYKAEHQTFNDIHAMEDKKLIQIIYVNNDKYILLTKTSVKYLKNKSNPGQFQKPTSNQLKTSCFLADYIESPEEFFKFFDSSKPYVWFLDKYKNELQNLKTKSAAVDMNFLNNNKQLVKTIKSEEIKSIKHEDVISLLKTVKIYFDTFENGVVTFILLDFQRSKRWIYEALLNKIEPIFRELSIYNSYNIKILTTNENREKRLVKDKNNISRKGILFLKNIDVINLNTDRFFQSIIQKKSFLKDIDKFEIATLQEKLKNNSKIKSI